MCQNMADIHFATVKVNRRDQTVLVSADIEDNQIVDHIGGRKCFAQFDKAAEFGRRHEFVPTAKRLLAVGMKLPECTQQFAGNDMHFPVNYRFVGQRIATRKKELRGSLDFEVRSIDISAVRG